MGAWRYQAITWINVEFLLQMFCDIRLIVILQQVHKLLFGIMSWKIIVFKILATSSSDQLVKEGT